MLFPAKLEKLPGSCSSSRKPGRRSGRSVRLWQLPGSFRLRPTDHKADAGPPRCHQLLLLLQPLPHLARALRVVSLLRAVLLGSSRSFLLATTSRRAPPKLLRPSPLRPPALS